MRVRRCSAVFIEPREETSFDLARVLRGGTGLGRRECLLAWALHLEQPVELQPGQLEVLQGIGATEWTVLDGALEADSRYAGLIEHGLLIVEGREGAWGRHREADARVRASGWWGPAGLVHRAARWQGIDSVSAMEAGSLLTADGLLRARGAPPPEVQPRAAAHARLPLPRGDGDGFDELLARRATCRNFDAGRPLPAVVFARMLQRVFAAQAVVRAGGQAAFLKKTSPSGGGLHAVGAYLLVQNVEGIAPGLYHYHCTEHALEPLDAPPGPLDGLARVAVAGQHWFADAHVLVVLVPRFARSFWKYHEHPKAYRALLLDAGHLSQTLYLAATDQGLGAFVTSAINEVDIEQALGLDPLEESPVAVCGFGWRAATMQVTEFDPAGQVWE